VVIAVLLAAAFVAVSTWTVKADENKLAMATHTMMAAVMSGLALILTTVSLGEIFTIKHQQGEQTYQVERSDLALSAPHHPNVQMSVSPVS